MFHKNKLFYMDLKINDKLYNEIVKFCEFNDITDVNKYINNLLINAFNIEKYGDLNTYSNKEIFQIKNEIINITNNLFEISDKIQNSFENYNFDKLLNENVEEEKTVTTKIEQITVEPTKSNKNVVDVEEDLGGYKLNINKNIRRR